jgi:hypothetical protein
VWGRVGVVRKKPGHWAAPPSHFNLWEPNGELDNSGEDWASQREMDFCTKQYLASGAAAWLKCETQDYTHTHKPEIFGF